MARIRRSTQFIATYNRKFVPSFITPDTNNEEVQYIPLVTRTYPFDTNTNTVADLTRTPTTTNSVIIPAVSFNSVLIGDIVTSATAGVTITPIADVELDGCTFFQGLPFIIYPPTLASAVATIRIGDALTVRDPADNSIIFYSNYVVDNIDYANRKIYYALNTVNGNEISPASLFTTSGVGDVLVGRFPRVSAKNGTTRAITIDSTFVYPVGHTDTTLFSITFTRSLAEMPVTIFRISVLDLNQVELNVELADVSINSLPSAQTTFDSSLPFCNYDLSQFTYLTCNTRRYNVDAQLNSVGFPVVVP